MRLNELPSNTQAKIIGFLAQNPEQYGFHIASALRIKKGSVYVILQRMEKKGLLVSKQRHDKLRPGLPLRHYSLTTKGQKLQELLTYIKNFNLK